MLNGYGTEHNLVSTLKKKKNENWAFSWFAYENESWTWPMTKESARGNVYANSAQLIIIYYAIIKNF